MIPDADWPRVKQIPGMVLINRILPGLEHRFVSRWMTVTGHGWRPDI